MTDFAAARRHMVDGQVRTADVTDHRIITAMQEVPRENFVPAEGQGLAYLDFAMIVAPGRTLLKPVVLAKLIHAAELELTDRVLVVGCATGYSAAILSQIAGQVVALEQDESLAAVAGTALAGHPNVTVAKGPLVEGWASGAPYDAILIDGAVEVIPDVFRSQLKDGGKLVCVLGVPPHASAMLYARSGNELGGRPIFDAAASLLPGFGKIPVFAF
jgi:protein-L-isoaspartate(D-aspartate) O-methyltransferase